MPIRSERVPPLAARDISRRAVMDPDLFERFDRDAFWNDPARMPPSVRVV
jgi:hypothetical protein